MIQCHTLYLLTDDLSKKLLRVSKASEDSIRRKKKSESEFRGALGSRDGNVDVIIKFIGNDDSFSVGDLKALENNQNEAGTR